MIQLITADYIKKERTSMMLDEQLIKINKDLVKLTHEPWVMVSCKKVLHGTIVGLLEEAGYKVEERNTAYTDVIILCVSIPQIKKGGRRKLPAQRKLAIFNKFFWRFSC